MLLNGKKIAKELEITIKQQVKERIKKYGRRPKLAVLLVGHDPASKTYVKSKVKKAKELGFLSEVYEYESSVGQNELLGKLEALNNDTSVDGILIQLPLPKDYDEDFILQSIDPKKDVDGLHPENIGLLEMNKARFVPCTAQGIMTLLKAYDIKLEGMDVLVIGRSLLVGNPITSLLKHSNATVTQAHSQTRNLKKRIKDFDMVVVAVGRKDFIQEKDVGQHQIIIDVGINREQGQIFGDVSPSVYEKVAKMTPVPNGVGPMTIISLMENTLLAYDNFEKEPDNEE